MSDYWNFEVKETYSYGESNPPTYRYCGETDFYIGICYKDGMPRANMTIDEVYDLAINATYFIYNTDEKEWFDIGGPSDFLNTLANLKSPPFDISWPQPFDNYYRFNRTDLYQVHPWRELLRRHFDQRALIQDRDLIIHKTYLKKKK